MISGFRLKLSQMAHRALELALLPGNDPAVRRPSRRRSQSLPLTINQFDPQYYALQLGTHVLGGGFYATRLYHDLRQVNGYVYTLGCRRVLR